MGQFSWIYSDTNRQLKDDVYKDTYLLIPEEFQEKYGKAINDKFPGAEMLSDVSSSGSFKYKEEFYKYKVETNVLYIECYSDSNINNVIISGKDY